MLSFIKSHKLILFLLFLNLMATGAGMGVPIFNIILGFIFGHYIGKSVTGISAIRIKKLFQQGFLITAMTFIMMLVIWLPALKWITDPQLDVANFGHPFFLYDPLISFIGWIALMILISPLLQLLAIVFTGVIAIIYTRSDE